MLFRSEAIVARCHEVESGARNIDHIITQTVLPIVASEVLNNIALAEPFDTVTLTIDEQGGFCVSLDQAGVSA